MEHYDDKKNGKSFDKLRIVFMGTPEFAVASLDALVAAGCNIAGVVTAPDKPAGRGMKLTQSAVKQYAVSKDLPVLQPEKLKAPDFISSLQALEADIQVVVAFRMLPGIVWDMPPMGTINVHGSLLPHYRGAAPINWAVINGEKETGVTTFKLQHAIDTGNILLRASLPIGENDTAGEIHDRMKVLGANLLVQTIKELAAGTLKEIDQSSLVNADPESFKHAPKIFTETCRIDWTKSTADIHNLIRGLSPYPGAFTQLDGKILKIYQSRKQEEVPSHPAGTVDANGKDVLRFATSDGYIQVLELQLEGKKRMSASDFLRGWKGESRG